MVLLLTLFGFALFASGDVHASKLHHIIGGTAARQCEISHIALVYVKKDTGNFQCAGSYVDERHVVTAAHCLSGNVTKLYVLYGFLNIFQRKNVTKVSKNVSHPGFDISETEIVNDIAVLTLEKAMIFDDCVKPIRLASPNEQFIGDCKVAGWGKTDGISSPTSNVLLYADVPLVDDKICRIEDTNFKEQHLCAGEMKLNGKTSCQGDSGGPLSCTSADDGETVLAGVVSYGWECTNGLSVFSKVSYFKDWIESELN